MTTLVNVFLEAVNSNTLGVIPGHYNLVSPEDNSLLGKFIVEANKNPNGFSFVLLKVDLSLHKSKIDAIIDPITEDVEVKGTEGGLNQLIVAFLKDNGFNVLASVYSMV